MIHVQSLQRDGLISWEGFIRITVWFGSLPDSWIAVLHSCFRFEQDLVIGWNGSEKWILGNEKPLLLFLDEKPNFLDPLLHLGLFAFGHMLNLFCVYMNLPDISFAFVTGKTDFRCSLLGFRQVRISFPGSIGKILWIRIFLSEIPVLSGDLASWIFFFWFSWSSWVEDSCLVISLRGLLLKVGFGRNVSGCCCSKPKTYFAHRFLLCAIAGFLLPFTSTSEWNTGNWVEPIQEACFLHLVYLACFFVSIK